MPDLEGLVLVWVDLFVHLIFNIMVLFAKGDRWFDMQSGKYGQD
jgi:hypothetical protein